MTDDPTKSHKSALIGSAGELLVAAELLRRGIDVAIPAYDRGVDLIAYREHRFDRVAPIQVKAGSKGRFGFNRAWFKVPGLILVHVWHAETLPAFYIFSSIADVEDALGPQRTSTASWREKGAYSITEPKGEAVERMQPHRDRWDRIEARLVV